jgi:hypothetical protein
VLCNAHGLDSGMQNVICKQYVNICAHISASQYHIAYLSLEGNRMQRPLKYDARS